MTEYAAPHVQSVWPVRLVFVAVMCDYVGVGAMRTLMPFVAARISPTRVATLVGGLESFYGLGQMVGASFLGSLSDRVGRRGVLLLSFFGSAVGYLMVGMTTSSWVLLLSRIPVGVSKQTITISRAIIADCTEKGDDRTAAMSRLGAAAALGYSIGPYLGGYVAGVNGEGALAFGVSGMFVLLATAMYFALAETSDNLSVTSPPCSPLSPLAAPIVAPIRRVIAVVCLPELAIIMYTSTAFGLFVQQQLGRGHAFLGALTSTSAACCTVFSAVYIPYLTVKQQVSDSAIMQIGCVSLALGVATLAAFADEVACVITILPIAFALAAIRSGSAAAVSKVAPINAQGKALGELDFASSLCRLVAPLAAGVLIDAHGYCAPLWLIAVLCLCGCATLRVMKVHVE